MNKEELLIYQAFLFGCYLSYPNDFVIDDKGNLVDERNIFTSDFNQWWENIFIKKGLPEH